MIGIVRDDDTTTVRAYVEGQRRRVDGRARSRMAVAALDFGTRGQPETYAISPERRRSRRRSSARWRRGELETFLAAARRPGKRPVIAAVGAVDRARRRRRRSRSRSCSWPERRAVAAARARTTSRPSSSARSARACRSPTARRRRRVRSAPTSSAASTPGRATPRSGRRTSTTTASRSCSTPQDRGVGLIVWVLPVVVLALGAAGIVFALRRWNRDQPQLARHRGRRAARANASASAAMTEPTREPRATASARGRSATSCCGRSTTSSSSTRAAASTTSPTQSCTTTTPRAPRPSSARSTTAPTSPPAAAAAPGVDVAGASLIVGVDRRVRARRRRRRWRTRSGAPPRADVVGQLRRSATDDDDRRRSRARSTEPQAKVNASPTTTPPRIELARRTDGRTATSPNAVQEFGAAARLDPSQPEPHDLRWLGGPALCAEVATPTGDEQLLVERARPHQQAITCGPGVPRPLLPPRRDLFNFERCMTREPCRLPAITSCGADDDPLRPQVLDVLAQVTTAARSHLDYDSTPPEADHKETVVAKKPAPQIDTDKIYRATITTDRGPIVDGPRSAARAEHGQQLRRARARRATTTASPSTASSPAS